MSKPVALPSISLPIHLSIRARVEMGARGGDWGLRAGVADLRSNLSEALLSRPRSYLGHSLQVQDAAGGISERCRNLRLSFNSGTMQVFRFKSCTAARRRFASRDGLNAAVALGRPSVGCGKAGSRSKPTPCEHETDRGRSARLVPVAAGELARFLRSTRNT